MKENRALEAASENRILREAIKNKYEAYRLLDPYRFPAFEFNTSRANYEPLRKSFEEEFYVKRGINRLDNNLHIPSANTLSFIFNDDTYLPNRRILNTCQSYANIESDPDPELLDSPQVDSPAQQSDTLRKAILLGSVALLGLSFCLLLTYTLHQTRDGLRMNWPHQNQTVPRQLIVEGNAPADDTVWIVIHPLARSREVRNPKTEEEYYVRSPVPVDKAGQWKGEICIGRIGTEDMGSRFQIRAFIRPENENRLKLDFEKHVFSAWPRAELSTEALEVVRGPEMVESPPR